MEIRKAELGDEQKLAEEFWHPLGEEMEDYHPANELKEDCAEDAPEEFRKRIKDEKYSFFFLELEDEEIAYISLEKGKRPSRKLEDYIDIVGIYVKKGFRDQGYGTKLIEKAKEISEESEAKYLTVSAEWENEEAREFYNKTGFEEKKVKFIQMVD